MTGDVCVVAIDKRILVQSFWSKADREITQNEFISGTQGKGLGIKAQLDPDNNGSNKET